MAATSGPVGALAALAAIDPGTIGPRAFLGYGALVAAATLAILFRYRARTFILVWTAGWLLLAAGLELSSFVTFGNAGPDAHVLGLVLLAVTWSACAMCLAADAFPNRPLRWRRAGPVLALAAGWYVVAPSVVSNEILLGSGGPAVALLLGSASVQYVRLASRTRHAGALGLGAGFAVIALILLAGTAGLFGVGPAAPRLGDLAVALAATSVVVWLGMPLLVFEDLTGDLRRANLDLQRAHDEVTRLAITDPLTGCRNRRFFEEVERQEAVRHHRYGTPLSVVFVDVDQFKLLNDTHGHDVGDAVLRTLGALLRRLVRESDHVFRWGGDEFVLLLACGAPEAEAKAEGLRAAFARECASAALPGPVRLSIGVAAVPPQAVQLGETIRLADTRMYRDKLRDQIAG